MKQAIIAVAVCCAVFAALSYGQQGLNPAQQGRFALRIAVTNDQIVWRLDTTSGALSACDLKNNLPRCTPWVQ